MDVAARRPRLSAIASPPNVKAPNIAGNRKTTITTPKVIPSICQSNFTYSKLGKLTDEKTMRVVFDFFLSPARGVTHDAPACRSRRGAAPAANLSLRPQSAPQPSRRTQSAAAAPQPSRHTQSASQSAHPVGIPGAAQSVLKEAAQWALKEAAQWALKESAQWAPKEAAQRALGSPVRMSVCNCGMR